jgi:hypothetical protein
MKPMSAINDIRTDEGDLVWVLGRAPRAKRPPSDTLLENVTVIRHMYERYDTVIELFDGRTGELLITQPVQGYFSTLLGSGYLAKMTDDEQGNPQVEIWRAVVTGIGRRKD